MAVTPIFLVGYKGIPANFLIVGTPQRVTENNGGAAAASLTVTAGNSLIAIVGYRNNNGGTFTNVTVTGESNMSIAGGAEFVVPNTAESAAICYLSNITASGAKTITANWSASISSAGQIWVAEISGGDTTGLLDQYGTNSGANGTMTKTLTTTVDGTMGLCWADNINGDPAADTGGGWTDINLLTMNIPQEGQYKLSLGAAGSKTAQMILGGGADWGLLFATFKPKVV